MSKWWLKNTLALWSFKNSVVSRPSVLSIWLLKCFNDHKVFHWSWGPCMFVKKVANKDQAGLVDVSDFRHGNGLCWCGAHHRELGQCSPMDPADILNYAVFVYFCSVPSCWIIVLVQAPCTRVLAQGYFRLALLFNCCKWLYRIRYIGSRSEERRVGKECVP